MATKNEILAQLYAIKAGLSIISQEKDKITKQESILQKIDNDLNRAKAELSRYKESARQLEQQVDDFESRLKNPKVNHVKKHYIEPKATWWIFVVMFFVGMILPVAIGAAIGGQKWFDSMVSVAVTWGGAFAGLIITIPIHKKMRKKAEAKADAQAEEEYQKALQREKQHQTAQIHICNPWRIASLGFISMRFLFYLVCCCNNGGKHRKQRLKTNCEIG